MESASVRSVAIVGERSFLKNLYFTLHSSSFIENRDNRPPGFH